MSIDGRAPSRFTWLKPDVRSAIQMLGRRLGGCLLGFVIDGVERTCNFCLRPFGRRTYVYHICAAIHATLEVKEENKIPLCRHTRQDDIVVARAINFMFHYMCTVILPETSINISTCYRRIWSTKRSRHTSTQSSMKSAASAPTPSFHPQSTHVRHEAPDIHLGQDPCSDPASLISILICYVVHRHQMRPYCSCNI